MPSAWGMDYASGCNTSGLNIPLSYAGMVESEYSFFGSENSVAKGL